MCLQLEESTEHHNHDKPMEVKRLRKDLHPGILRSQRSSYAG